MNTIIYTFKTRMYPDTKLKELFSKAFGTRRFVWNWSLNYYQQTGESNNYKLSKILNSIKDEQYPWMNEIWSNLRDCVLKDFSESVSKYYKEQKLAHIKNEHVDTDRFKPRFKKKGKDLNTFRMNLTKINKSHNSKRAIEPISKHYIDISGIGNRGMRYRCKIAESLLFLKDTNQYKLCIATITERANQYYLAITYEKTNHKVKSKYETNSKVGIDMGIHNPITYYNGQDAYQLNISESLYKQEMKTEKINKQLSKKYLKNGNKKSKNYEKLRTKLNKSYLKENQIKDDFRKQVISQLVHEYNTIIIEGYPINRIFNKNINRSMSRLGLYTFMEHLRFKCKENDNTLIEVPKGTPTTQTCCLCGHRFLGKEKLSLKDRTYKCPECNNEIDRDINASINIYNYNKSKNCIEECVAS